MSDFHLELILLILVLYLLAFKWCVDVIIVSKIEIVAYNWADNQL